MFCQNRFNPNRLNLEKQLSFVSVYSHKHQFADDTQLLVAMNVTDAGPAPALEKLANCSAAVRLWFLRNDLQLNADKSEVVIIGTAPQLRSAANIREVEVAGSRLQVASKLKSLGITIDSHLRFDCNAKEVARACNYHSSSSSLLAEMRTEKQRYNTHCCQK